MSEQPSVPPAYYDQHAAKLDPDARIVGLQERWVAPVTLIDAVEGFGEAVWLPACPETLLTVWLAGARTFCRWGPHSGKSAKTFAATLQPRGAPNHFEAAGRVSFAQIYLPDPLLDAVADALRPGSKASGGLRDDLIFMADRELDSRVAGYIRAARQDPAASRVEMEARALLIVERLLGRHHGFGPAAPGQSRGLSPWQVKRVQEFLAEAPERTASLETLSGLVQLSPFHFAREFKAATGLPPHRYQIQLRLQRARALLETTDKGIGEIAAEIGYDTPSHLAKLFRKEYGVTPARYRRERRR